MAKTKTKKKNRKIPFIVALVLAAYIAFLAVCSLSSGIIGTKRVGFTSGSFPVDADSITVVLQNGETGTLDQFENLKSADFSGSTNYAEILDWAGKHPGVQVTYTVELPNGAVPHNYDSDIDLSGLTDNDIPAAAELLKYLPNASRLDLGTLVMSSAGLDSLKSAFPDKAIDYLVPVLGQALSPDETEVNLSGLTSAQMGECLDRLSLLPSLASVTIGDNATQSGELSWQDIKDIASAAPNAAINYGFSLNGQNVSLSSESINLTSISSGDVDSIAEILPAMTKLKTIKLGNITPDDVAKIAASTSATIDYPLTIYGQQVNLSDEIWDFNHIAVSDSGAEVAKWLPCANNLKYLDMDTCGVSNSDMAALRDINPNVEVIWRVNFGSNYSVRTNVTKILASKPSKGGTLYNADVNEALKYCTKVRYLDLGHNENISDFSFVTNMPDLEIAVISMSNISDLTPFASCPNLMYLEAGNTGISDLSPLANCTKLKHLNVGTCFSVKDISSLYELDLLRLWLGSGDPVPSEQVAKMKQLHPNCEVNTTAPTGLERDADGNITNEGYSSENWKSFQKYMSDEWYYASLNGGLFPAARPFGYYKVAYKAFQYNLADSAYAFSWNDPKYDVHDSSVKPVNTFIIDTSFLNELWDYATDDLSIVKVVLTDPPGDTLVEASY